MKDGVGDKKKLSKTAKNSIKTKTNYQNPNLSNTMATSGAN